MCQEFWTWLLDQDVEISFLPEVKNIYWQKYRPLTQLIILKILSVHLFAPSLYSTRHSSTFKANSGVFSRILAIWIFNSFISFSIFFWAWASWAISDGVGSALPFATKSKGQFKSENTDRSGSYLHKVDFWSQFLYRSYQYLIGAFFLLRQDYSLSLIQGTNKKKKHQFFLPRSNFLLEDLWQYPWSPLDGHQQLLTFLFQAPE